MTGWSAGFSDNVVPLMVTRPGMESVILIAAIVLLVFSVISALIVMVRGRKNKQDASPEQHANRIPSGAGASPLSPDGRRTFSGLHPEYDSQTVDEKLYGGSGQGSLNSAQDLESTVADISNSGIALEFTVRFDENSQVIRRVLLDTLILGRGTDCDIDVTLGSMAEDRKKISRRHAALIHRPTGLYVNNVSETNELLVDGKPCTAEMPVADNVVLQMGDASVQIRILQF